MGNTILEKKNQFNIAEMLVLLLPFPISDCVAEVTNRAGRHVPNS